MLALQEYASSSDDENSSSPQPSENSQDETEHLKPIENPEFSVKSQLQVCAAPLVVPTVSQNNHLIS